MALSFFSNSEAYESEINDALLSFYDPVDFSIDSLFNSSEDNTVTEPIYSDSSVMSIPKRQKCIEGCNDYFYQGPQTNFEANTKVNGNVSVQSAAARERRRKISEKTQELGKLIPGGSKMNTAQMFHAAYKYVKFLQAQVGILQLISTMQVEENVKEAVEELGVALKFKGLQEKLSSEEKCIVPRAMVDELEKDVEIRSKPFVAKDLARFKESIEQ